uniref:Venom Kazal domain peptide Ld12a n=1 Tax=Lethocerus distinctifemur TaxID=280095 RepID=A0A2K8JLI7_9HEMI|nr:venom Kazal domain peptide Ld12a [Lethocerus distinctifemur]
MKYFAFLLFAVLGLALVVRSDESSESASDESCMECTREYRPVCGHDGDRIKTFSNKCELEETNRCKKTNFTWKHDGKCEEGEH